MPNDTADQTAIPLQNERYTDRENISWLWNGYFRHRAKWLVLIVVLLIGQAVVYQQFIRLTESGLRVVFESGSLSDLIKICLTVFAIITFRGAMSYAVPRLAVWIASSSVLQLRKDLIDHLMQLDLSYFDRTRAGESILRLTGQADSISQFIGVTLVTAIRDLALIVIMAGYLIWRQPLLFTIAAIVLPLLILVLRLVTRKIRKHQIQNQLAHRAYVNALEETINGIRTVKIAGQESVEKARISESATDVRNRTIKVQSYSALALPLVDFGAAIVYAVIIGGGGYMVLSPNFDLDGAAIIAFMIGLVLIFDPARRVSAFITAIQANFVVLAIVRDLFGEKSRVVEAEDAVDSFQRNGDVQFQGVGFGYENHDLLFSDLTLDLPGGKTTAIVGPTGSGKTTILSLLSRLYEPTSGQITIGGTPVNKVKLDVLRASFSVVSQDIVIFDNSIWDNIAYVMPEASEDQIWAAAEAGEIADLIRQRGDTPVGPKGAQLSGGQRQRIGIARAFLRDAPIVLLDEATSALDQATEEKVKRALTRLTKDKTTVVVAHRLSSISDSDKIYVLESGNVAEYGTHAELMAAEGLYAKLYSSQKAGYGSN